MSRNERLEVFLFNNNGIENIFKNIGWITASVAVAKSSIFIPPDQIPLKLFVSLTGYFLLAMAVIWGWGEIIIPFLQAMYGDMEKFSKMKHEPRLKVIRNSQFWVYLLVALTYAIFVTLWFDSIFEARLR